MRWIIIIILSLFLSKVACSQVTVGPKVGLNSSKVAFSSDASSFEAKRVVEYHLGGLMELGLNKKTGLSPELLFSSKGFRFAEISEELNYVSINYISLPVSVYYKPVPSLAVILGPEINKSISSRNRILKDSKNEFTISNNLQYSVNAGVRGYFKSILVEFRYNYQLSEAGEIKLRDVFGEDLGTTKFYNRTLQFSVGYLF